MKLRLGLFSNIKERFPNRLNYYRILFSNFMRIVILITFLYVVLLSFQNILVPSFEARLDKTDETLIVMNQDFQKQALIEKYNAIDIESVIYNSESFFSDTRLADSELGTIINTAINILYPTLAVFLIFALFVFVLFPLLHVEIRFVPIAVLFVFAIYVAIAFFLNNLVLKFFPSDTQITLRLIITVGITLVIGELVLVFVKYYFKKPIELSPDKYFQGNIRTKHIHHTRCPFVSRTNKKNLVKIESLVSGIEQGYICCSYCLGDLNKQED